MMEPRSSIRASTTKRRSYVTFGDDDEALDPTLVFIPGLETASGLQAVPRDDCWDIPSTQANVFLTPPCATDPPPPWPAPRATFAARTKPTVQIRRVERRRSEPSILPLITFALAAAIVVGLWHDVRTRRRVAADVAHATSTAVSVVTKAFR